MEVTNPFTVETIILGLASYYFPLNLLLKQKCVMRRRMSKPRGLKVKCYAARLIELNKYLALFPGGGRYEKLELQN